MSSISSFAGGVRIPLNPFEKSTGAAPIEILPAPKRVTIALSEGIALSVSEGDNVLLGQTLTAENEKYPIHASVSGKVIHIHEDCIVIESDGNDTLHPSVVPFAKRLTETSPEEIAEIVRRAGIRESVDAVPAARMLTAAMGKARRLIINCTECEPFLASRRRLVLERPADVLNGTKILLRALELTYAEIVIEESRIDAIRALEAVIGNNPLLRLRVCATKYPQSKKRLLINTVSNKELPPRQTTAQLGYAVFTAETCADIFRAFASGLPQTDRLITIGGDCIKEPKVLRARIGTPLSELTAYAGGVGPDTVNVICNSLMNGSLLPEGEHFVCRGDIAYLFLSNKYTAKRSSPCIRCGKCVELCPMHLLPNHLTKHAKKGNIRRAIAMGLENCIECGTCSYACPCGIDHVQYIRQAKEKANDQTN